MTVSEYEQMAKTVFGDLIDHTCVQGDYLIVSNSHKWRQPMGMAIRLYPKEDFGYRVRTAMSVFEEGLNRGPLANA